jgi:uncharacterized protein YdeI (YjbR/CyaY-like superfamily)
MATGAADRRCAQATGGEVNVSTTRTKSGNASAAIHLFEAAAAWAAWLEKNHRGSQGVWLRLAKKCSSLKSLTYTEALEIALCYGWIDGQKRAESGQAWLQRFVPRTARSIWSKINGDKAVALIVSERMTAAGLDAVEAAKECGRWDAAYDSPKGAQIPPDFQVALDANSRARKFFQSLDGANRYAVLFRIQTVKKAETRARKIREFVKMLERNERIHGPRRARRPRQ